MLRKLTTRAIQSSLKHTNKTYLHTSPLTRMPCIDETPDDPLFKFRHESSCPDEFYKNNIEMLLSRNKTLERELCDARSLLTTLFFHDNITNDIETRIRTHLHKYKDHRIEEHKLLTRRLENEMATAKEQIDLLNIEKENLHKKLAPIKKDLEEQKANIEKQIQDIGKKRIEINASLNQLNITNMNCIEFLKRSEVEETISRKFSR